MNLRSILISFVSLLGTINLTAQFGYGFTLSNDLYHVYTNPKDNIASSTAGSAVLNLGAGPKFWFGNKKISLSFEAQAIWGVLSISSKDNKGLGSLAFPILAKLNFKGLSGFEREGKTGFNIGGGLQYSKTEIYGLADEFAIKGVKRDFYPTYVIQVGYGYGISGFDVNGFIRYGFNNNSEARVLSIGLQYDFNAPVLKKISNPDSEL
jgi:hypothetical protein